MASIHRDPRYPQGVWYVQLRLSGGKRTFRSTGERDRKRALSVAAMMQAAEDEAARGELTRTRLETFLNDTLARVGLPPHFKAQSVADWLEEWLATRGPHLRERTFKAYRTLSRLFLESLGSPGAQRRLDSITTGDIERFIAGLRASGRAPGTINKLRDALSGAFALAAKTGRIGFNPVLPVAHEKREKSQKAAFSLGEIEKLLRVASPDWQGAILFAYSTGARLSDVANLRWSSLDIANGVVVFVQRKTNKQAVIGLHPDFLDRLTSRSTPQEPHAFVFASLADRIAAGPKGLSIEFTRLVDRAGIEKRLIRTRNAGAGRSLRALSFHSLRHTAASSVFNSAALREITRRVTAHTSGSGAIERYLHEDLEAIRAAVNLIPRLTK